MFPCQTYLPLLRGYFPFPTFLSVGGYSEFYSFFGLTFGSTLFLQIRTIKINECNILPIHFVIEYSGF